MKKCEEIMELISLYVDGELCETEKQQFEEHINSCVKCREELDLQMEIINLCHNIEEADIPEDFDRQLHEKLVNEKQRKGPLFRMNSKYIKLASSVAAAVLLIFITSKFLSINQPDKGFYDPNMTANKEDGYNLKSFDDCDAEFSADDIDEVEIFIQGQENSDLLSLESGMAEKEVDDSDALHRSSMTSDVYYEEKAPVLDDVDGTGINAGSTGGGEMPFDGGDAGTVEEIDETKEGVQVLTGGNAYPSDIIVRVSVINKSSKPENTAYIVDTANKLGIEVVEGSAPQQFYDSSGETTALIKLAVEGNKYDLFVEELESNFTNITINVIADQGAEKIVEISIE